TVVIQMERIKSSENCPSIPSGTNLSILIETGLPRIPDLIRYLNTIAVLCLPLSLSNHRYRDRVGVKLSL
ncbi:MAG: hypothetical protein SAJ12_18315, partial [Jaaginema sp. PMC 1079.18]|nr:hypothetical protein [Jaaginema sp. PMC 1079.18]